MSFAAQEFIEHLLCPGLFCGYWGLGGEEEAPGSRSETRSRTHQAPFMPRDTKAASPLCSEPGHKAELPKGGEGQTTQAVLLQDPEPSPQQPLPSLTILSLQPISGRLCEQMGGQVGVVRANTCGAPPA